MVGRARGVMVFVLAGVLAGTAVGCSAPAGSRALAVVEGPVTVVVAGAATVRGRPPLPAAQPAGAVPMFESSVSPIDAGLAARMSASWRAGCPVPLEDLRYVTFTHVDFDGQVRTGEVVVHADVADGLVGVFAALFEARYPIRQARLVDDFGGDDTASMYADNTSAFNCRAVTGGTAWSEHAYGRAIDINPVENPYVVGGHVGPGTGRPYASRPDSPGVVHADDVVVQAFAAAGWQWAGYWDSPKDYQHFSTTGR
jgi:hypothetical protein